MVTAGPSQVGTWRSRVALLRTSRPPWRRAQPSHMSPRPSAQSVAHFHGIARTRLAAAWGQRQLAAQALVRLQASDRLRAALRTL
eukprot:7139938-Alexandrium_andersonii.AAC.1